MFRYFQYRNDLKKILVFEKILKNFCDLEQKECDDYLKRNDRDFVSVREFQYFIQQKCMDKYPQKYLQLRKELAQMIPSIRRIAHSVGVNTVRESYPVLAVGGPIIPVDIFESVLEDHGYVSTTNNTRFDCVDKIVGILKEAKSAAFFQMLNHLCLLSFILKVPFLIIKQTGFNVDKIENALWGKLFKLLFTFFLIYGLLRLGFSREQLLGVLKFLK